MNDLDSVLCYDRSVHHSFSLNHRIMALSIPTISFWSEEMRTNGLTVNEMDLVFLSTSLLQSHLLGFALFLSCWLTLTLWLYDLWIESFIGFVRKSQIAHTTGIKLFLFSEFMIFISCFVCLVNYIILTDTFSCFFTFPLIDCYSYGMPFSNTMLLLLSSIPVQGSNISTLWIVWSKRVD